MTAPVVVFDPPVINSGTRFQWELDEARELKEGERETELSRTKARMLAFDTASVEARQPRRRFAMLDLNSNPDDPIEVIKSSARFRRELSEAGELTERERETEFWRMKARILAFETANAEARILAFEAASDEACR